MEWSETISRLVMDSEFERVRVLGVGSFGRVVLCRRRGALYAVKLVAYSKLTLAKHHTRTKTEREVLATLEHRHIVTLHYAYRTPTHFALVLEYCAGGELFHHLCRQRVLGSQTVAFYSAELALALECCHSKGVLYRDLKPENCLLDAGGHLKLADFGLAKTNTTMFGGARSVCGTLEYMAPDILAKKEYGHAVDWWGLGIWTYELLTGLPPWRGRRLFAQIRNGILRFPPYVSVEAASFVSRLLKRHPRVRMVGEDVFKHEFVCDFDLENMAVWRAPIQPSTNVNFDAKFAALNVDDDEPASSFDYDKYADWDYVRVT